jgi:hypothetical protein
VVQQHPQLSTSGFSRSQSLEEKHICQALHPWRDLENVGIISSSGLYRCLLNQLAACSEPEPGPKFLH